MNKGRLVYQHQVIIAIMNSATMHASDGCRNPHLTPVDGVEPSSHVHASTWWLRGGRTDTWERNVILIRKLNRICLRTSDNGITSNFSLQNKNQYTVVVGARPLALEVNRAKSILTDRHWLKSFPCRPPTPRLSSEMFDVVVARYGAPIDRSFWNPLCPP